MPVRSREAETFRAPDGRSPAMIAPGRRRARQLLHHAFEALRARESSDVGLPAAGERRGCGRAAAATNVPLPTRETTRPRAASNSYACETVTSAQARSRPTRAWPEADRRGVRARFRSASTSRSAS